MGLDSPSHNEARPLTAIEWKYLEDYLCDCHLWSCDHVFISVYFPRN